MSLPFKLGPMVNLCIWSREISLVVGYSMAALCHTNMFENPLDITNYRSLGYAMLPPTLKTTMPRRCFSPFTSLFVPEATLHCIA